MKLCHFLPLLGFVSPTLISGFGFVLPRRCIAGFNTLRVGFGTTVLGACRLGAGPRLALRAQDWELPRRKSDATA